MRILLTTTVLALTPFAAIAQCEHAEQTMTCAEGTVYDAEAKACVKPMG